MKANLKLPFSLALTFLGSILIVIGLYLVSFKSNRFRNNFIRLFPSHFITNVHTIVLKTPTLYIAGVSNKQIYLADYSNIDSIFQIERNLIDVHFAKLNIPEGFSGSPSLMPIIVDSPFIYMHNYITGAIGTGTVAHSNIKLTLLANKRISTNLLIPFSSRSFAIRSFDAKTNTNMLGKLSLDSPFLQYWPDKLQSQIDGVFSTDGLLCYERKTSLFTYVYFYRNEFICFDSSFKMRYHGHTLDTNTYAKIKVIKMNTENKYLLASPGFYVNRTACVTPGWLMVNSDVKADNESENTFRENAVIDVYSLKSGQYHFSYYIPKNLGKISYMAVSDSVLYTIQDTHLSAYTLNLNSIRLN